jgi:hypothetical protein
MVTHLTDVKWVSCLHDMEHSKFADVGDAIQTCRVAADILGEQSCTVNKVYPPVWRVRLELNLLTKKETCYEVLHSISELNTRKT